MGYAKVMNTQNEKDVTQEDEQDKTTEKKLKTTDEEDHWIMGFRSTGLGTTLLEGEPGVMEVLGDVLIFHVQSTRPVRWKIRTAITHKGLMKVIGIGLSFAVIKFLLFGWLRRKPLVVPEF